MHRLLSGQICRNTPSGTKHFRFKGHHSKRHWCDKREQLPTCKSVTTRGKIAICTNCTMSMKITSCSRPWFLNIHIQDSTIPETKIKLAVFHDEVKKNYSNV